MKCWHYAALKAQLAHMTALIATTAAATSHLTDGAAARHGKGLKRTRAVGLKGLKPTLKRSVRLSPKRSKRSLEPFQANAQANASLEPFQANCFA